MRGHLAPKDLHLNKLGKGPLCNVIYQIQASLSQVVLKKLFEYFSMYFYSLNLGPPRVGPSWTLE